MDLPAEIRELLQSVANAAAKGNYVEALRRLKQTLLRIEAWPDPIDARLIAPEIITAMALLPASVRMLADRLAIAVERVPRRPDDLSCSFCGKGQAEVKKLVAGPNAYICNECIDLSASILREEGIVET